MMVGFSVCEAAHLDCEHRTDGTPGLLMDPMVKPLTFVSIAAISTCILNVGYFLHTARRKNC